MLPFILRRGLKALLTMYAVVTVVFMLTRISGDPIEREYQDTGIPEAVRQQLMVYYGLDKPVLQQYVVYLRELARGNAGLSFTRAFQPVTELYADAFKMTGKLIVWCFFFGPLFGIPLGIIGAIKRRSAVGQGAMLLAFMGYAVPNFIIAIGLVLVFGLLLGWLPTFGDSTPAHYIMPIVTLSAGGFASIARYTRSSMLDVMSQDYIRTARGKGMPERTVIYKHALRNVLIPVVTIFGTHLTTLLTGSIIVETIFAWPGFGQLIVRSVQDRDYPSVQFGVIIVALIVITSNLIVDVLYGVIDPRIRTES